MIGWHWVKSWSKTQSFIVFSLWQSLSFRHPLTRRQELLVPNRWFAASAGVFAWVMAGAFAASGITVRRGICTVRHLDVDHLLVQEVVTTKRAKFVTVTGVTNLADMMTSGWDGTIRQIIQHLWTHVSQMDWRPMGSMVPTQCSTPARGRQAQLLSSQLLVGILAANLRAAVRTKRVSTTPARSRSLS